MLLAEEVTRQYLGTHLEAPLRTAVEKINRYHPERVQVDLQQFRQSFHFSGGAGIPIDPVILAQVQQALKARQVLHIRHYTASRDAESERSIEPHFLTNVRGDWMLVAWDRDKDQDRVFMLSRIRECCLMDTRFKKRPELEPGTYSQHMFLTEHNWEPYAAAIRFDSCQARRVRVQRPPRHCPETDCHPECTVGPSPRCDALSAA